MSESFEADVRVEVGQREGRDGIECVRASRRTCGSGGGRGQEGVGLGVCELGGGRLGRGGAEGVRVGGRKGPGLNGVHGLEAGQQAYC